MFEFMQNFQVFNFNRCRFNNNSGYLFDLIPSENRDRSLGQVIHVTDSIFKGNKASNSALFHVFKNSRLELVNSRFERNVIFGRGTIVFIE